MFNLQTITPWCEFQLPFVSVILWFLHWALGMAVVALYLRFRTAKNINLFGGCGLLIFLIVEGLEYAGGLLPAAIGEASHRFEIAQILGRLGLFAGVMALWGEIKKISLGRQMIWTALMAAAMGLCAMALNSEGLRRTLSGLEMIFCYWLALGLYEYVKNTSSEIKGTGKMIFALVVLYALQDLIAWSSVLIEFVPEAVTKLVLLTLSIPVMAALVIAVDFFFLYQASIYWSKKNLLRQMLIAKWIVVAVLATIGWWLCGSLVTTKMQALKTDASKVLDLLTTRIDVWEQQNIALVRIMSRSPFLLEYFRRPSLPALKDVDAVLDRYANGVLDGVCYLLNTDGLCLASSNRNTPESFVRANYAFRDYFVSALASRPFTQFARGVKTGTPGVFSSHPVWDPRSMDIIGVAVMRKELRPEMFFQHGINSFLMSKGGDLLLESGDFFKNGKVDLDKDEGIALPKNAWGRSADVYYRVGNDFYLYQYDDFIFDGINLGVFYPMTEVFIYGVWVYAVLFVVLIFAVGVFLVVKFSVLRTSRELETAAEFKTVLDSSPNCITIIDDDLTCRQMNGLGVPFLGRSPEEFVGSLFIEIWHPFQRPGIQGYLQRVLHGDRVTFEGDYMHPEGFVMNFLVVCGPMYAPSGKIKQIVAIWVDITNMKKIERELIARLDLEKAITSVTTEFLTNEDADEAFAASLKTLLNISGGDKISWYQNEASDGPPAAAVLKQVITKITLPNISVVGGREEYTGVLEKWRKQMDMGRPVTMMVTEENSLETEYCRAHGALSMLALPIYNGVKWEGYVRIDHQFSRMSWNGDELARTKSVGDAVQDNLTRAQTQEMLRLLSEAVKGTDEGIVITEMIPPQGADPVKVRVSYVNAAMTKILGYSETEYREAFLELLKTSISDAGVVQTIVDNELAYQSFKVETICHTKDGRDVMVNINAYPINSKGSLKPQYLAILRDVTQERELQNRSSLTNKLESIGQLAAGIAHEINTPAQFISDNLFFIKENWDKVASEVTALKDQIEEVRRKRVEYIIGEMPNAIADGLEGVQRISAIVKAMREFSHSSNEKTRADINKAIETTATVARNEWKYYADVVYEFDKDLPALACYIGDLNQVILNLMVNAAHAIRDKWSPEGKKGLITFRTQQDEKWVIIQVQDNANGIPDAIKEKVFDPFFTTKKLGEGTGQGLYLVRRIVTERHGGTIEFASVMGEGTTFTIRLPKEAAYGM